MSPTKKEDELHRLAEFHCPDADTRPQPPTGVLLSDEIQHYVSSYRLIEPFDEANLKPAGYELTIGDEYVLGGQKTGLRGGGEIRIPPFNVVVIKTAETINLPRFLIARWNIRVRWAYEGLLWVGGPQVDPGWVGHLFCPIYNLSDKEVVLREGDAIALMDFVTTTPFRPGESKEYHRAPKRVLLEEYGAERLKSALFTEAKVRIDEVEKSTAHRIDRIEGRMDTFVAFTFVAIGILFAVLSVFTTADTATIVPVWPIVSLVASAGAFVLALVAWWKVKHGLKKLGN